jgi:hypothetical protein
VPSSLRDKSATWRSTSALGWSKSELLHEMRSGRPYKTFPPDIPIDWWSVQVERSLDMEAGQVTLTGMVPVPKGVSGLGLLNVGIKIWDGEPPWPPSPTADVPGAPPAPRRPSDAAVERCFREIQEERPDDPPSEKWMLSEMTRRLGASPIRQRVRELWKRIAPRWKRPQARPRSAKKPSG